MRDKSVLDGALCPASDGPSRSSRIQADLERRGVALEFSQPAAQRLQSIVSDLTEAEYEAVLEGVAAAYGVHRESTDRVADGAREVTEIQHLMEGFTTELHKLEEGLRILSAYVSRMSSRSSPAPGETLH